jgi:hypothetical protein
MNDHMPHIGARCRTSYTFDVVDGPVVETDPFMIHVIRCEATDYGDRARVIISGPTQHRFHRQKTYSLYGYKHYDQCPEWVADLVRQAGYLGKIEGVDDEAEV